MIGGGRPLVVYSKIRQILTHLLQNANFQSIFAHSASAVAPSKKNSINTNRKSTARFPISLRWTSYVVPKPLPGGGGKNAKCLKFQQ